MRCGRSSKIGDSAPRLQFSLRSMLVLMTFSCLGLSLLSYVSFPAWALPVVAMLAWSGLIAAQGAAALAAATRARRRPETDFWALLARRRAMFLAASAAIAPLVTFLVVASFLSFFGADVEWSGPPSAFAPSHGVGPSDAWLGLRPVLFWLNAASVAMSAGSLMLYFRPWLNFPFLLVRILGLVSASIAATATMI